MRLVWNKLRFDLAGSRGELSLSPLTAIVAPPAFGKTMIINCIRLAMTGDLGVLGKRDASSYLSSDSDEVFAELTGRAGKHDARCSWRAKNNDGSLKDPLWSGHPKQMAPSQWLLPEESIRKTTGGALHRLIAERFGAEELHLEDPELQDRLVLSTEILNGERGDKLVPGSMAAALEVAEWCSSEIRTLGRKIGAGKRITEKQEEAVDPDALRVELEEKKKELLTATAELENHPRYQEVMTKLAAAKKALGRLDEKIGTAEQRIKEVESITKRCEACGSVVPENKARWDKLMSALSSLEDKAAVKKDELQKLYTRKHTIEKAEGAKVDILKEEVAKLEGKLETVQDAKRAVRSDARDMRRLQEKHRELREAIDEVLVANEKNAVENAMAAVAGAVIPGMEVVLRASPLAWGIKSRGAGRFASMSGSQGATLDVALLLAWANTKRPPVVLLDDEDFKHFSSDQTKEFLERLWSLWEAKKISQVIAAYPDDRVDEIPAGYSRTFINKRS